MLMSQI